MIARIRRSLADCVTKLGDELADKYNTSTPEDIASALNTPITAEIVGFGTGALIGGVGPTAMLYGVLYGTLKDASSAAVTTAAVIAAQETYFRVRHHTSGFISPCLRSAFVFGAIGAAAVIMYKNRREYFSKNSTDL